MAIDHGPIGIRDFANNTSEVIAGLADTGPRAITNNGKLVALLILLTPIDAEAGYDAMAVSAAQGLPGLGQIIDLAVDDNFASNCSEGIGATEQ